MGERNFVIIGATGSIGSEACKKLLDTGGRVVAGVRDLELAKDTEKLRGADLLQVDAEDWDSVDGFFDEADALLGRIDGVAVCVGSILLKPAHLTRREEFERVLSKNLSSCFAVLRSVAKRMMKRGGSIVFISSAAARHGFPNHEAIAAAKAGVIGLTLSAAATYAGYGIRVNCLAPGLVRSKMAKPITDNEMSLKASQSMHALGRIGNPEEIASAVVWLLQEEQSWLTGETIGIDGGLANLFSKKR